MILRFTPHARLHIEAIADHINQTSSVAAFRLSERIRFTTALLTKFPYIGHEGSLPGTREILVPGTSYIIVHRVEIGEQDSLVVLGVYHCAQKRQ